MTLSTITIDGNNHQSYVSLAEANSIITIDPVRGTKWAGLTDTAKMQYIVAATHEIDLLQWAGERAGGSSQDTAWPRMGLRYENGDDVPSTIIPSVVERATALLAGTIAMRPAATTDRVIQSVKAGSVEIEYADDEKKNTSDPLGDQTAYRLVSKWLQALSNIQLSISTGTSVKSAFADRDAYAPSRGL